MGMPGRLELAVARPPKRPIRLEPLVGQVGELHRRAVGGVADADRPTGWTILTSSSRRKPAQFSVSCGYGSRSPGGWQWIELVDDRAALSTSARCKAAFEHVPAATDERLLLLLEPTGAGHVDERHGRVVDRPNPRTVRSRQARRR